MIYHSNILLFYQHYFYLFRYIYETLFMEGRDSDIIVSALNRDWKLHKLYLCQSPYFASMFNGNWRESNMDHIDITIVDPNISLDSMNVTLGKLRFFEPYNSTSFLVRNLKLWVLFIFFRILWILYSTFLKQYLCWHVSLLKVRVLQHPKRPANEVPEY